MIEFRDLNDNQRRAVEWNDGPLLVLAGPGSGKTMVLTLRAARLLKESDDSAVLALMFTNKAAAEMRERVDQILGWRTDRVQLSTFHGFAAAILRQHGSHIGLRPNFDLLTRNEDRIEILDDVIREHFDVDYSIPEDRQTLLRLLDRLFSEAYSGKAVIASIPKFPQWLPYLFNQYCRALISANWLDFGSLIYFAQQLLREKPAVARVVRLGWTHICVDEFQDTNKSQYELLRLIAPDRDQNLFVVADDDQIIYQWNGASVQRFADLRRNYAVKITELPESYRCPPAIVNLANKLIAHNTARTRSKELLSGTGRRSCTKDTVRYRTLDGIAEEARFIAQDIRVRARSASDCIVLGRTNRLLEQVAKALSKAGQEAFVSQRKSDFESPLLRVFMESLRLTNSRHDRIVLMRICRAWHDLTDLMIDPFDVEAASNLNGGDFLRAWLDAALASDNQEYVKLLRKIRTDLLDRLIFPGVVEHFVAEKHWTSSDLDHDGLTTKELETWKALHQDIIAEHGQRVTLNTYLQQLDLSSKALQSGPNALRCSTVHGSKGLQFKHVYIVGMAQEVFPSFLALKKGPKSKEIEEERRNCFVAITRAQETLTLTGSREYFGYPKEQSQFLTEMGVTAEERQASLA